MFEKIQAVVVFFNSMLNVCDFLFFFSDAVSFILVFITFEPLLLPVFFDTGNGTIYESMRDKNYDKKKNERHRWDLNPTELRRLAWRD